MATSSTEVQCHLHIRLDDTFSIGVTSVRRPQTVWIILHGTQWVVAITFSTACNAQPTPRRCQCATYPTLYHLPASTVSSFLDGTSSNESHGHYNVHPSFAVHMSLYFTVHVCRVQITVCNPIVTCHKNSYPPVQPIRRPTELVLDMKELVPPRKCVHFSMCRVPIHSR